MRHNFLWDAVVIGGGPAGLAAGMHLARAGCSTLLVERRKLGGQARGLERIENYPGFPRGVSGARLMGLWLEQARRWGLAVRLDEAVSLARGAYGIFSVRLKKGCALRSRSVLWCAGAGFRRLGVPGESALLGKGVWNTYAEAPACAGLEAAVIGSGEAAVQQAALIARRAAKVYLISRTGKLKAHKLLLERMQRSGVIRIPGFRISRLLGKRRLEAIELKCCGTTFYPTLRLGSASLTTGRSGHARHGVFSRRRAVNCSGRCESPFFVGGGRGFTSAATFLPQGPSASLRASFPALKGGEWKKFLRQKFLVRLPRREPGASPSFKKAWRPSDGPPPSPGRSRRFYCGIIKLKVDVLFTLIGKEPVRIPAVWQRKPAGFFEAGDAAAGIFRQVAVAGGDGIRAAMRCISYLEGL
ncbi:MAG: FAD-dependent oxidoreductase [Elusimicrobia bacterium]|nr:FAD-dependent oxidoreductase [Elusimicrobiota bacterium]